MDPFDDLYARVIVEHALAVRSGQSVLVEGGELAEPLVRAVHRRVLEAGGHPTVQMLPDGWIEARAESAAEQVLAEADPLKLTWYERVDCRVTLLALANVEQLAHVDAARAAASEAGRLRAVHVLVDRDARGEAVWCGAQYPTAAFAQAAGLSLDGYRELLARAQRLLTDVRVALRPPAATASTMGPSVRIGALSDGGAQAMPARVATIRAASPAD